MRWLVGLLVVIGIAAGVVWAAGEGRFGTHEGPGEIRGVARSAASVAREEAGVAAAAHGLGVAQPKQILFGDLHVHTTFSFDAFNNSLPVMVGEGAHPPADACDFARYCSALDFWSINDHAEAITSANWRETIDSIRQCNAKAADPANPDLVSFLGWEWTHVGTTPDDHYGHKNVVLRGLADAEITARPIAAAGRTLAIRDNPPGVLARGWLALAGGHPRYHDLARYFAEREGQPRCAANEESPALPADCLEVAATPADLYRKLREWGVPALVIPHGTTWGMYTPPASRWDKQLAGEMHDPSLQRLLEVFSGHGDGEVYRDWEDVTFAADGTPQCPSPRPDYLPSCWRAGEIIEARCLAEGTAAAECAARAEETRRLAAAAGIPGHLVVDGEAAAEWLDAGQCRDCRQPSFNYRPGGSAQYIAALGNFDDEGKPRHFRFGFMASSDNHFARAGTGYKQRYRRGNTESNGEPIPEGHLLARLMRPPKLAPSSQPRPFDPATTTLQGFQLVEFERQTSYFMMGGLVAAHARGRQREAIWDALQAREVYGTTGQRTLLWFELVNPPGAAASPLPMGAEVAMDAAPTFTVRAVGSFEQKPGCPADAENALGIDQIERLCKGECYHPSDIRRLITRIDVVRIRPQATKDEDVAGLVADPWRSFACPPDPAGCTATFTDDEFPGAARDTVYYARVFETPDEAINAGGIRCERDAQGNCTRAQLCPGPTGAADDCLAPREPRAWSSPIYVDFAPAAATAVAQRVP
jgi:hypothetical protein